jgi:hypothetical protein
MVNKNGTIIHKVGYKKGYRHDYDIYKENHPVTPEQVVNVFDLGYLGIEKDFPAQLSSIYLTERKEICNSYPKIKENIIKVILKRE